MPNSQSQKMIGKGAERCAAEHPTAKAIPDKSIPDQARPSSHGFKGLVFVLRQLEAFDALVVSMSGCE